MKKCLLLFIFILFAHCAHSKQQNNMTIIIGGRSNAAPYSYTKEENEPDGFAVDVIKSVMQKIGLKYQFRMYSDNDIKHMNPNAINDSILADCDISLIALPSSDYKRNHYYSLPYSKIYYHIISNKATYSGLKDLAGKDIIARKGSSAESKLLQLPSNHISNLIGVTSVSVGIKMLTEGAADYMILDDYSLQNFRYSITTHNLNIAPSNFDPLNISFASDNGELVRLMNQVLEEMDTDGSPIKLYNKWMIVDENEDKNTYLYIALLIMLGIITFSLLVIFTLRRVVTRAKGSALKALTQNQELISTVNMLLKNSNTEILMFNAAEHQLYVLDNGVFVHSDIDLHHAESSIHPDDLEQYKIDYHNILSSKTDYVSSNIRIFDSEINDYKTFEYTFVPSEKDKNGVISSCYYSRRDTTETTKELRRKERIISSFTLAMRSANLIRWQFDIKKYKATLHYSDGSDIELTPNELLARIIPEDVETLRVYIKNEIEGNEQEDIIIKASYDNYNEYRICKISSLIQRDKNGKPESIFGVVNDITDITQNNQKLEELQRSMQLALDSGQMTAWRYDMHDDVFISLYGPNLVEGRMTMSEYMSYVHPKDNKIFPGALEMVLNGKLEKTTVKFRLNTQSKGYKWYSCSLMPIKENGKIKYVTGTRRDITTEMESIIELEKNQYRLQTLFDKVPTPVYIVDPEYNKIVYCNDQARLVFGFNIGDSSTEIYSKEQGEECAHKNLQILNTGKDYIANETLVFSNGNIKTTFVKKTLVNYNGREHILISRADLTEQERMTQAQKLLSTSLPAFNAFTWSINGNNHSVTYNDSGRTGISNVNEVSTIDKCMNILHPEDRQLYKNTLLDYIDRGKGEFNMIYRSRTSDDAPYEWWETRGIAEASVIDSKKYTVLYGVTINITQQKLSELSLKESQDKLIEINKQNELILNNSSSGIVYINSEFEVLWSNIPYAKNLNLPSNVFEVGTKCYMVFGRDIPCENCPMTNPENKSEIEPWTKEIDLGIDGIYHVQTTPVIGDNKFEGAVLRIDNITERAAMIRDLEQEKERVEQLNVEQNSYNQLLSTVIEKFPGILFIKNVKDDFRYMFASTEFCSKAARLPRENIIGHTDSEIFEDLAFLNKVRQDDIRVVENANGNMIEIGEEDVVVNGEKRTFHTIKLAVELSNNQELLIGSSVDITNIKKINEDLIIAREKAEESERLKMAFLANMSHEIRTPLNAIVGFSELLQDTTDENDKQEYINIINKNNDLLLRLIGDILDLSKIESGTIELKPEEFDFASIMHDIFTTWQQRNTNPDIDFKLESPYKHCWVNLDSNRVSQVGINFVSNAFKYTPNGEITMGYIYENCGIKLYVKDTGISIPIDKHNQIFGRFAKIDDFAQGTGLGLAISKAITEVCGGKIGFESKEGIGSTFWAWFPCEAEITESDIKHIKPNFIQEEINNNIEKGINILIAEDNDSNYMLINAILKNYNLTRARNGAEAVEFAKGQKFDTILMDMRMPVMDGLEATRRIREFDKITPIIAVTANAFQSDRAAAKDAGCNDFITKPLKKKELEKVLGQK